MELNNNFEVLKNEHGYKLIIIDNATRNQYEIVLNYLIKRLRISENEVEEIDDFDSYYYIFYYNKNKIVLSYSNDFGISIYFFERNVKENIQLKTLKELSEILSNMNV